ncbi:UvrD-helicase domain-containing protein [Tellurirhabdus rosea]|uniref:UvrD-helicase domain-containing protein n=1 Tax=Tellurirhabdus rosea TaxID=2674997 RepID=UPI002250337C|nr:UvrD-helicase domain-containing protein [Tellurirhabdus rosea]
MSFKIYSSSAGSGKTYTLTKEYLKLALRDRPEVEGRKPFEPHQFKHILAVTFTNAAANEMKERILKELERMVRGEEKSLLKALAGEIQPPLPADELQKRAKEVFLTILHDYSSFSVLTIDSFVQRVVTAFTDDLELPYSFEVEMETDTVLQTAIERLIEKVNTEDNAALTEVLDEYYRENASEGRSWYNLSDTLVEFSRNQLGDKNYDYVKLLADLQPEDFRHLRRQLRSFTQHIENSIQQLAASGYALIQAHGIELGDFLNGKNGGVGAYFEKRAFGSGLPEPGKTPIQKALTENRWYTGKKHEAIDAIKDILRSYIEQIEDIVANNGGQHVLYELLEKHLQKISLLKQIRQECDDLLREQNRVHISEFNRLILEVVANEPVPFVYERLGEKYHHILIDEFQDTSRLQFINLLPLIENNLGYDRFNLAVGDAKQAIYRFRGGDMDQIVALHRNQLDSLLSANADSQMTLERLRALPDYLQPERLGTNWRSAESIVEFNNRFFGFLAAQYQNTDYAQVTDVFDEEFRQQPIKAGVLGHVQIDFFEKPEQGDEETEEVAGQITQRTLELIRKAVDDGYTFGDVAILCRFKKNARLLADFLKSQGIPLTSEDSLTLMSSERVRFLLALMQLLYQPDNRLVRYELLFLYHRIIRYEIPAAELARHIDERAKSDDSVQLFEYISSPITKEALDPLMLAQLSVYELAEKLSLYYNLFDDAGECPYIFRFLDEVLTFSARFGSHLGDFLAYWESVQEKISVSAPADANAVTITTIHKSKGLEYPVVIVPFADWSSKPRTGDTIWMNLSALEDEVLCCPPSEDGPLRRLRTASVTLKKDLVSTPLAPQYRDELYRTFVECMNLLYVAFTRPTDRLYILSLKKEYETKKGEAKNQDGIDFWLYNFLKHQPIGECGWEEGQLSYVLHGCQTVPNPDHRRKVREGESLSVQTHSREGNRPLRLRRLSEAMQERFAQNQDWENKVCKALSLVRTPACIEKTIRKMVAEGQLRPTETAAMQTALQDVLAHPELARFYAADLRTDGQRPILLPKGVAKRGASRVVHTAEKVILLDYQNGQASEPQRENLEKLRLLYQKMGHRQVEARFVRLGGKGDVDVTPLV